MVMRNGIAGLIFSFLLFGCSVTEYNDGNTPEPDLFSSAGFPFNDPGRSWTYKQTRTTTRLSTGAVVTDSSRWELLVKRNVTPAPLFPTVTEIQVFRLSATGERQYRFCQYWKIQPDVVELMAVAGNVRPEDQAFCQPNLLNSGYVADSIQVLNKPEVLLWLPTTQTSSWEYRNVVSALGIEETQYRVWGPVEYRRVRAGSFYTRPLVTMNGYNQWYPGPDGAAAFALWSAKGMLKNREVSTFSNASGNVEIVFDQELEKITDP